MGKGIGEVMPKLFEKGFTELNLNRIEGYVSSDNIKCKTALEKINFAYEGTMRESEIKNGKKLVLIFIPYSKVNGNNSLH